MLYVTQRNTSCWGEMASWSLTQQRLFNRCMRAVFTHSEYQVDSELALTRIFSDVNIYAIFSGNSDVPAWLEVKLYYVGQGVMWTASTFWRTHKNLYFDALRRLESRSRNSATPYVSTHVRTPYVLCGFRLTDRFARRQEVRSIHAVQHTSELLL